VRNRSPTDGDISEERTAEAQVLEASELGKDKVAGPQQIFNWEL
jgi:hypothetical protein